MDTAAEACSPAVLIDPRVDVYFELCTRFRVEPCAAVTIALRFPDVSYLQLDSTFGAADLLPLAELLRVRAALRRRPAAPRAMRGPASCRGLFAAAACAGVACRVLASFLLLMACCAVPRLRRGCRLSPRRASRS